MTALCPGRQRLHEVAGVPDSTVRDDRDRSRPEHHRDRIHHRAQLGQADAGHHPRRADRSAARRRPSPRPRPDPQVPLAPSPVPTLPANELHVREAIAPASRCHRLQHTRPSGRGRYRSTSTSTPASTSAAVPAPGRPRTLLSPRPPCSRPCSSLQAPGELAALEDVLDRDQSLQETALLRRPPAASRSGARCKHFDSASSSVVPTGTVTRLSDVITFCEWASIQIRSRTAGPGSSGFRPADPSSLHDRHAADGKARHQRVGVLERAASTRA